MKEKATRFLMAAVFVLCSAIVTAATITVTNTNDSGAGSLRTAISSAVAGDTIDFSLPSCPCTIALTSSQLLINKNLIINGPGASQLTISGNNARRVFAIQSQGGSAATISNLTIANGAVTGNGGGLSIGAGSTLTLSNAVITDNVASGGGSAFGGGIFADQNATLNIINSTVTNNTSSDGGGGIGTTTVNNNGASVSLAGSNVSNNTALIGGGVYIGVASSCTTLNTNINNNTGMGVNFGAGGGVANNGTLTMRGGTVNNNAATGGASDGGGINNTNTGIINLTGVIVSGNTAPVIGEGGGINSAGTLTLNNCIVSNNQASSGGGINCSGILTMTNSTVAGNTANGVNQGTANGGGIDSAATATITNSTISGNTGNGAGGGINNAGTLSLTNSTLSGNRSLTVGGSLALGGGINNSSNSTTNLVLCTITLNSSAFRGGGVFNNITNTTVNVSNSIIAQNTTPSGGPDATNTFVSQGYNLIGNASNAVGFTNGTNGDIVGGNGPNAINPMLGALLNNGGGTQTHALLAGSPAIDNGNAVAGIVTDQRGGARFVDLNTIANPPGGNGSDIGAFEFNSPTAAAVEIRGRVLLGGGVGLSNAIVTLFDDRGATQSVRTGSFGYYGFSEVEVGRIYILTVRAKRYTFAPQVVSVTDEVMELNFYPETNP